MESIIYYERGVNASDAVSFEQAAIEFDKETKKNEELSCNQLLKNILKTNLSLLKLNHISNVLSFY
ncbi:hypothetical protein [Flavobacterium litorale]|uniref:Uncharacterized protein n=1 Tax=Flavobacterium litorale TaxID=2856519 RepID=A0ABX8V4M7_9FLAO|nr:hypothetical protein [Flavobacterium litorale]QYJ67785.1 hypothetical protein K1I41_09560 [Flavobacterium litorale]